MKVVVDHPGDNLVQRNFMDEKVKEFLTEFKDQLIDEHCNLEVNPVTDIASWRTVSGLESPLASLADFCVR